MSGFVAAFSDRPAASDSGLVARMSEQLAHRGAAETLIDVLGVPTISVRNPASGAYRAGAFVADGGVAIFDGMLWNEAELIDRFGGAGIAEAIWRGYDAGGIEWLGDWTAPLP